MREFHELYFPNTLFEGDIVREKFTGREGRIKRILWGWAFIEGSSEDILETPALDPTWEAPLSALERVPLARGEKT